MPLHVLLRARLTSPCEPRRRTTVLFSCHVMRPGTIHPHAPSCRDPKAGRTMMVVEGISRFAEEEEAPPLARGTR